MASANPVRAPSPEEPSGSIDRVSGSQTMPEKRRLGRPPGSGASSPRLSGRLNIRLAETEWAVIRAAAAEAGWSVSRYVRTALLERARDTRIGVLAREERELMAAGLFELHRQGSNLNQLAFAANKALALGRLQEFPDGSDLEEAAAAAKAAIGRITTLLESAGSRLHRSSKAGSNVAER